MLPFEKYIIEGDVHSSSDWQQRLNADVQAFSDLRARNVLRKIAGASDLFRMDFVGLIVGPRKGLFVFPKVFDLKVREAHAGDLSQIVRCIQRFESRLVRRTNFKELPESDFLNSDGTSPLALFLNLLSWTRDHGLHNEDTRSVMTDPPHIDWEETFDRGLSLHFATGVAFADVYGREAHQRHGKIAVAQAMALIELFDKLDVVTPIWISGHDPIIEDFRDFLNSRTLDETNIETLKWAVLEADLHSTKDHERALISSLRQWIDSKSVSGKFFRLYGVNAFHVVWEDMCRVALLSTDLRHSEIASQPSVAVTDEVSDLGSQRPDIMIETADGIIIADAKWYRSWRGEYPGTSDTVKQIVYELSVLESHKVSGNIFIVPLPKTNSRPVEVIGKVCMRHSGAEDNRFPQIEIVGVLWDEVLSAYISGTNVPLIDEVLANLRPVSQ